MKTMSCKVLSLLIPLIFVSLSAEAGIVFEDDFKNGTGNWTITNNDASYYSTSESGLDLRTCSGDMYAAQTDYKNLFTITSPPAGALANDFTLTMALTFQPTAPPTTYPQICLVAYDDDDNWVRVNYMLHTGVDSLQFVKEVAQSPSQIGLTAHDFGAATFYLRLTKTNHDATATYKQEYSTNGIDFTQVNGSTDYGDGSPGKVGFIAMVDSTESNHAYITNFQVDGVPEPSSLAFFGMGLIGLLGGWLRKRGVAHNT